MGIVLVTGILVAYWVEAAGNPLLTAIGSILRLAIWRARKFEFGPAMSALYATATTGTSTGSVNSMHNSFTPLGELVPMFNMLLGCVTPGGDGAGLYGFLMLAVIAVFVAGLMVGRTPEYLVKKIETREMKLAMLAVLIYPLSVVGFSAASVMLKTGLDSLNNAGPHGLSEVLYAFASTNANNGSAFAGLSGNTLWYNTTLGLAMFLGRFAYVIPVLALAGFFAAKKKALASAGTFPNSWAFVRRPAARRHPHFVPPPIFPGSRARPYRRALPAASRQGLLNGVFPCLRKPPLPASSIQP